MGPVAGRVIGGAFFLLLSLAALTSTISLLEVPAAFLVDEKKWPRRNVVIGLAAVVFLIGLPSMLSHGAVDGLSSFLHYEGSSKAFMDLIEDLFLVVGLPLGGCLMSIFIGYRWKTANLSFNTVFTNNM